MNYRHLFLIFSMVGCLQLSGQDFHNSFIQFTPITINPALTGAYYGNIRASLIARDQGRPISTNNEFQDFNLSADGSIDFGFTEGDWISVGGNFVRSQAGETGFTRQFGGVALAYHLAFGKDKDRVFSAGLKYGSYSTKFDPNAMELMDPESLAGNMSVDLARFNSTVADPNFDKSAGDYNVGFMFTTPMGKSSDVRIGFSADHMFKPRFSIGQTNNPMDSMPPMTSPERLDRRFNGFIYYYTSLSDRVVLNPNILYQKMGESTNILIQGLVNYLISPKKDITLIAGVGVRFVNSTDIPIFLGADIKSWRVGLSYDTNVAGLSPSTNTFGALELGVSKIFAWSKPAVVKPVFICPRL